MKIILYQVDAFTNQLFGGNPAAVCPLEHWLPEKEMQQIAMENNLSETAFFVKQENGDYHIRWFTPTAEIDLCGHATLAAAFIIFEKLEYEKEVINFQSQSGLLTVRKDGSFYYLDFPSRMPSIPSSIPAFLLNGSSLGSVPQKVLKSRDYLVVFESEEAIVNLTPHFEKLAALDALGIIATAPGKEVDFVSRFFAPAVGVPEDPVTGSAHCTLIPYWAKELGKDELTAFQLSGRKGFLKCKNLGKRVEIGGEAVLYLEGFIAL